jgi:hypothetical protein
MRAVLLSLLLAACATTSARADDAMAPFAPLLGCWSGAFEGNANIHDERCFETMLGGRYVRDTHAVRPTDYAGETIYFVQPQSGAVAFRYFASDGGGSSGMMRVEAGALVFDAHEYVGADGQSLRMRSRWTIEDAAHFVIQSEVERDGAWQPWGRIAYTRTR